ncbi:hypothetical protein FC99_GL002176 [Levilactobacillus koreensis JCM 16448]|uniref:Cell surface protein n=1 Tax=Levilactobacillus koreensis TaxID=637971 RepID=A0AAC8UWN9_9LACO|nr:hypothetical protein [Levilactobacillus koreensis]AKP64834.1 hypothetical protein ABN16_07380 [Levilactobacillus koreensis]KRK85902.1 hypothetical protein FC99_GL002176 [Levilactobacillus koreensis JCM 16448]
MKFRKLMMQLGLLLAVVLGVGLIGGKSAEAKPVLPFQATEVSNTTFGFVSRNPHYDSKGVLIKPLNMVGNSDGLIADDWPFTTTISGYPQLVSVAANNVSTTPGNLNRVTDRTTKIYMAVSGSFQMASSNSAYITSLIPYITSATQGTKSMATNTPTEIAPTQRRIATPSTNYYEFDVNLSDLRDLLPLRVGFKAKFSNTSQAAYMGFADIASEGSPTSGWQSGTNAFTVNSTYSQASTGSVTYIKSSDKVITGSGRPGLKIAARMDTSSGQVSYVANIGSDGKFSISLPDAVANLTSGINVYEFNDTGDVIWKGVSIKEVLDLQVANSPTYVDTDSIDDNISGKSDSQILDWLVKEAGITVTHNGAAVSNSDVTFSSTEKNLATQIANLKEGESTTVDVAATSNSDSKLATDGTQAVKVVRSPSTLEFTSISPIMDFGSVPVPSKETLFAPKTSPEVFVKDTQSTGTPWSVLAQATDLTSNDDGRTLAGHMVYVDADGNKQSMASAVEVAAGTRIRDMTNGMNVVDGWSKENQSLVKPASGMYLDALPSIYSGSTSTTYTGTIYWQLTNAPGAVAGQDLSNGWVDDGTGSASSSSADSSSEEAGTGSESESESGGEQSIPGGSTVSSSSSSIYNGFG